MNFLKGRTNRATYWLCVAIMAAILLVFAIASPGNTHVSEVVLVILCVPRLHDIGRSGWLVLAPVALEVVGVALAFTLLPVEQATTAMGFLTLVIVGLMVWLGAIPGQPAANRFGAPPLPGLRFQRLPR